MNRSYHEQAIKNAIQHAEDDGYTVEIENECCGCSKMYLILTGDGETVVVL